ncbi:LysR family transcriptional regulator [Bosea sp. (in: a-proteobacteria)]|jgi:DNA-binding transcriptional LysR family regulator|uniref:LysR family transcriptional regulator n=1 Tax=Bosea sp. (in: a-proteobacteria) TaxID=1871050 RepID=UPI001ACFEE7C|nr:LysR family transcriptional regulator [Bosea sp. (in: a-proteobacteria)]MBN9439625.1 LysR family transcriptional regulator [Bosea sp. (in: a-proteobacteria)]MBN9469230.1 LysR family transcriptional regulator [Bosea sp. (in: a-proteobacteria)]
MALNFRQTEILWAIVMAGSSSGAARLLNVSQPAVSKMLSQIEAQLGSSLFERVRGKLQPTEQVRLLFDEIAKAQKIMRRVNDIADSLTKEGGGALSLASIPSLAYAIVPGVIARFRLENPEIVVRLETGAVPEMIESVLQGEAELGLLVMLTDHPLLTVLPLFEGRMLAALPRNHPLAVKPLVSLADLSPYPHILVGSRMPFGMLTSSAFEQAGLPCRVCADVTNSLQACALVDAGVGVALVDEFTARNLSWLNVVTRPLKEKISLRTSIVHSRNRPPGPLAKRFIALLRQ